MRDSEAVFASQAIAAYEAANPDGAPWTHLPPGEWGRWNAVVKAVLAVPTNESATIACLTAERDEWAAKWHAERRRYAQLRWPGMTREVRALDASDVNGGADGC